jgi:hypothetical protein
MQYPYNGKKYANDSWHDNSPVYISVSRQPAAKKTPNQHP